MTPIETLEHEHRTIERVLDSLENWAHRVVRESQDGRAELAHFTTFFREFLDGCRRRTLLEKAAQVATQGRAVALQ